MKAALPALLAAATIGGCDDNTLGTYRVDKITIVDGAEVERLMQPLYRDHPFPEFRVELSTDTDIVHVGRGQTVYMWGDFCPFRDEHSLSITPMFPDGEPPFPGEADGHARRARRDAAGRYHYVVYIDPRGYRAAGNADYDLRTDTRDLCLRAKGTFMFPPHSAVVVIPHSRIAPLLPELVRRTDALRLPPLVAK